MDFFYSKSKLIQKLSGVHFLQDHVGSGHSLPWDDYGFVVTFKAYYVKDEESTFLGELKILAEGFDDTSKFFAKSGDDIGGAAKSLKITNCLRPDVVVSLATGTDYYERLKSIMSPAEAERYLSGVCDAGFYIENYDNYIRWKGVDFALLRDGAAAEARIKKGYRVAMGNYSPEPLVKISISTLGETFEPVSFVFNNEKGVGHANINLLIGPNGTGKSHILKHVTELLTGIESGTEVWPYFHKLIVVAYSPFESFYSNKEVAERLARTKGGGESMTGQLTPNKIKRLKKINKYSYIGFKNDSDVFNGEWPPEYSVKCLLQIMEYDKENQWKEQSKLEILVATLKLSVEFDSLALKQKTGEMLLLDNGVVALSKEKVNELDVKSGIHFVRNGVEVLLSSGQKIYSYMMPALVAEIESESLIVIDEPELYLHPSLEVGLITMLRSLLVEMNSYAIIATHSAILAREVKSDSVRILRKRGAMTTVSLPTFETYGESLDVILGEAFGDYDADKPYQQDIDGLISGCQDAREALNLVGEVGDEAVAYVLAKFNTDDVEIIVESV